jgi:hypothetical protein
VGAFCPISPPIQSPTDKTEMSKAKHYSPSLDRHLVSRLYWEAKSRRLPMTRLASMLVQDGLNRLEQKAAEANTPVAKAA